MIRSLAVLAALSLSSVAVLAQDATPTQPPAADITIDPTATVDATPKSANLLTGLYATQATIEICAVAIEPATKQMMDADRGRMETALGMDAATASEAYAKVKADVETTTPDCADNSPDRIGVDAVTAAYAAQAAAAPATPPSPDAAAPVPAAEQTSPPPAAPAAPPAP